MLHQRGFSRTTLADISRESGVPLGNVYYYFKTKNDIAAAVINERFEEFEAKFRLWEKDHGPRERIMAFAQYAVDNKDVLTEYGCPVGGLCQEMNKGKTGLSEKSGGILKTQVDWVAEQVEFLGRKNEAKDLATHFISALQGMVLLANALNDPEIIEREGETLKLWVYQL